jgi:hypothetical protein
MQLPGHRRSAPDVAQHGFGGPGADARRGSWCVTKPTLKGEEDNEERK